MVVLYASISCFRSHPIHHIDYIGQYDKLMSLSANCCASTAVTCIIYNKRITRYTDILWIHHGREQVITNRSSSF